MRVTMGAYNEDNTYSKKGQTRNELKMNTEGIL